MKCGKESSFTCVGPHQCAECNDKSGGTISLNDILEQIIKEKEMGCNE
jgi:hypothetical protein